MSSFNIKTIAMTLVGASILIIAALADNSHAKKAAEHSNEEAREAKEAIKEKAHDAKEAAKENQK